MAKSRFLLVLMMFCKTRLTVCNELDAAANSIVCPKVQSTDKSMRLKANDPNNPDYREVSGLGFSSKLVGPSGQPLFYVVNDSGGGRRIGIFDSGTGSRLKSLRLPSSLPAALDYESITVGSCGVESGDCVYIADVGDNRARTSNGKKTQHSNRNAYPIYKVREPNIEDFEDGGTIPESNVTTLQFTYSHPTSPTAYADCEATFLDNVGWGDSGSIGDFYIVTKWEDEQGDDNAKMLNRLFKIPAQVWSDAAANADFVFSPAVVGAYDKGEESNALMGHQWTRAEMTLDGTLLALGDYYDQYLFLRCPGMSVAEALAVEGTQHCEAWPVNYEDSKFETIAWAPDKLTTLEISECSGTSCNPGPPMVWTTMDYTFDPINSTTCPVESSAQQTAGSIAPSHQPTAIGSSAAPSRVTMTPSPAPTTNDSASPTPGVGISSPTSSGSTTTRKFCMPTLTVIVFALVVGNFCWP